MFDAIGHFIVKLGGHEDMGPIFDEGPKDGEHRKLSAKRSMLLDLLKRAPRENLPKHRPYEPNG
jgi:hypothetical protein